jgi:hypothetical protein
MVGVEHIVDVEGFVVVSVGKANMNTHNKGI